MAISFGKLLGMAECKNYEVARVSVHKWQKKMLGFIPKGRTKEVALKLAQEMEPSENWLKNKRCKVPHDGIIDSFLIAHYYRNGQREKDTSDGRRRHRAGGCEQDKLSHLHGPESCEDGCDDTAHRMANDAQWAIREADVVKERGGVQQGAMRF